MISPSSLAQDPGREAELAALAEPVPDETPTRGRNQVVAHLMGGIF